MIIIIIVARYELGYKCFETEPSEEYLALGRLE
jgi:hypothetical protein